MEIHPHKTAITRKKESPIASFLFSNGYLSSKKVLDYGAGRGKDYSFYIENKLDAYAYDSWDEYGFSKNPVGTFDIITCLFVFNVLTTEKERVDVLLKIKNLMTKNSILYLAVRSEQHIEKLAKKNNWEKYNDGYLSSVSKGTFQKGFDYQELLMLFEKNGFKEISFSHNFDNATTFLALELDD